MNALTNEEKARLILSVGKGGAGGKRLLSPIQVAEYLDRCVKAGSTTQSIAKQLTIGNDMVLRFLSLRKLSPLVQSTVDFASSATTLSFSVAHQIARLADTSAQEELAKAAIANNLSKQDVTQVVQRFQRSGDSVEKSVEAILALKPTIERRHVVIGSVTSRPLEEKIRDVKVQDQRDKWGFHALSDLFHGAGDYAVRITPDRFTLSGGEQFFAALMKLKPDFETVVNDRLLGKIDEL
jgi:hypothetical protein